MTSEVPQDPRPETPATSAGPSVLASLRTAFDEALRRGREVPSSLTHYTNQQGAQGIISESRIWATDPRFLNDTQELQSVHEPIVDGLNRFMGTYRSSANVSIILDQWSALIRRRAGLTFDRSPVYVACFCEQDDLLSQWRGYGGSNGPPYALSFASPRLPELLVTTPEGPTRAANDMDVWLVPAVYDHDAQTSVVVEVLSRMCAALVAGIGNLQARPGDQAPNGDVLLTVDRADEVDLRGSELLIDAIGRGLSALLPMLLSAAFKSKGFEEEREWRLVVRQAAGAGVSASIRPEFRPTKVGLAPFVALAPSEGLLPIRSVRQGPVVTAPSLGLSSMRLLLQQCGYGQEIDVSSSATPYRAP